MKTSLFTFAFLLFGLVTQPVLADDVLQIRPHFGTGNMDGASYTHAGLRMLLKANSEQKYGLELTRVNTQQGDYLATGIVLEQKKMGWFNMSIGTIAYLGHGSTPNLPGLVSNLGWEPDTFGAIKPFVTLRNDFLFDKSSRNGIALSAGINAAF